MAVKSWKRAQVERTRAALLKQARARFGERGYAGTALEEMVHRTGMTRGAVYHHFKDKRALFEAVLEPLLEEGVDRVDGLARERARERGGERESDTVEILLGELCDGVTHRILCVDGPSVLGRERWSELMGARLLEPVRRAVQRAAERGALAPEMVAGVTRLLFGAIQEAALLIGLRRRGAPEREQRGSVTKPEIDEALMWMVTKSLRVEEG